MTFGGLQIRESIYAITMKPARVHKHRRSQTERYHLRIQKKWKKRFGMVSIPGAYRIQDPFTGQPMIIAHPSVMTKLRGMVHA
jgi:hypothetical protein